MPSKTKCALHCNAFKMDQKLSVKSDTKQCILVWSTSHALLKTIEKNGVANQVWPQQYNKDFLSDTKQANFPTWGNLSI